MCINTVDIYIKFSHYKINISDNDKKNYSKVVKKINEWNIPFLNVPTLTSQPTCLQNNKAIHYMAIHQMVDNCEFGNMKSNMICDCFVICMCNQRISEQLQIKLELKLTNAAKE